ncbi:ABC transporter permease [Anoxybacillus rupiensis]|jgi:ABC-2 type transport system permease protein|uniref:ABC transporter permease n=1 Tax=Anoxybacteroides rupiense TaxID=311460 RepID=A0ABT5W7B5_9BACL|nr:MULTISPECIES: ABC transporter permease [Anoxybacillus]KXG10134.1 Inner membrane transport permease YhhJ [Anoxybacillus sp. P3H1B]MBS2770522.1 ABC transporter permease [Anoxybacillus rupiensis]MDE8565216.1 ABC transporter permease [Anoxybacillus rupiensis]QHC03218.1 ABC transporter permease [Anoxybacillus sp. PDR2]
MQDVMWLVRHTLKKTFSNKKNILLYFGTPLIGIIISLLVYSGSNEKNVHIGIVNNDPHYMTNDTIHFIKGLEHLSVTNIKESEIDDQITSGKLDCVLVFHPGFSKSVQQGRPDHLQIVSIHGSEITGFIKSYLYHYINNISALGKIANGDERTFLQMYERYQQSPFRTSVHSLKDTSKNIGMTYQTIGYLLMIMLFSAGNLAEMIVKEKENRTYFRLLSAPINGKRYVLSNIIVNMIVMTGQIILTLVIMDRVFHIKTNIAFWQMAVVLMLFSLVAIGIAFITVAFANSSASAGAMQNLIVVPTCMLSGCFWPADIMPTFVQKIANFLPQRWTLDALLKLQQGHSFGSLYLNLLIILAFALIFFLISAYKFGRNNNVNNFV